jgi:hypothetical protein
VNGANSTFVGYGPETLTIPREFYPGVSSLSEYGAHFALELNEVPRAKVGPKLRILEVSYRGPDNRVAGSTRRSTPGSAGVSRE